MIRWLRVVLPPPWTLLLAGLFYAAVQAVHLGIDWYTGSPLFSMPDSVTLPLFQILGLLYGVYRAWAFHPIRPDYFRWLCATPWTSRQPLPLGPVHLVLQDVLVLGLAVALCWPRAQLQAVRVVETFLGAYLLALAATHFLTGQKWSAYAVPLGVGFMLLSWRDPVLLFSAAAATYGIALAGLRRTLALFPWERSPFHERGLHAVASMQDLNARMSAGNNGWPYDRLGPPSDEAGLLDARDILLLGMLTGWWYYVMSNVFTRLSAMPTMHFEYYHVYFFCLIFGVSVRLWVYCHGYLPPLSLLGRLAHGRLLIPGYDQVFAAPLLAVAVFVVAWNVPGWTGLEPIYVPPVAVAVTFWVLCGMAPSLRNWRLTGNHRIVPGVFNAATRTR